MIPTLPPQNKRTNNVAVIVREDYARTSGFWMENSKAVPSKEQESSAFWKREQHFEKLFEAATKTYEAGWDGYDAEIPNDNVRKISIKLLDNLKHTELSPYSVLPSADGGIGISFRGLKGKRAMLEILNDGSSSYVVYTKGREPITSNFDAELDDLGPVFRFIKGNL